MLLSIKQSCNCFTQEAVKLMGPNQSIKGFREGFFLLSNMLSRKVMIFKTTLTLFPKINPLETVFTLFASHLRDSSNINCLAARLIILHFLLFLQNSIGIKACIKITKGYVTKFRKQIICY